MSTNRTIMKAVNWDDFDTKQSDQKLGVPMPDVFKSYEGYELFPLPSPETFENIDAKPFHEIISNRRSRRKFTGNKMSLETLAYLVYSNCGVTLTTPSRYFRAYPSGGNRQAFETYLIIQNVEGLKEGVYRYIPLEHALIFIKEVDDLNERLSDACVGQSWVKKASVTFVWSCIPYRGEWRYMERSHKVMLLDAGHLCQNLYLACEALDNLGTCAIGAYDQTLIDSLIEIDGEEEFVVYLSPVGFYE